MKKKLNHGGKIVMVYHNSDNLTAD